MDPSLYPQMAKVEDTHWWFAARRAICGRLLDRITLPPHAAILEPGCGTGGNFAMLARRGDLFAMDSDQAALRFAAERHPAHLAWGSLPDHIPFGDTQFDLAVMTDVIEHLDNPLAALRAVRARLKKDGWIVLTVPANPWLWSDHDSTHHHRRRYRADELSGIMNDAGFKVVCLTYYNFVLFVPIAAARLFGKLLRGNSSRTNGYHDLAMPREAINRALYRLFASERYVIGTLPVPFGVSLITLGQV